MTGKRGSRARKSASTPKSSAPKKAAREATHLADKSGKLHDNVTVFEPTHGPNMSDRMDTMADPKHAEKLPATDPSVERAGIPPTRRIDPGQSRGGEE